MAGSATAGVGSAWTGAAGAAGAAGASVVVDGSAAVALAEIRVLVRARKHGSRFETYGQ